MADNGFKAGYANALQSMMEAKLPGSGIKATPHITSRLKTLKRLWQMAYDIVYEPNTSGFGWDPEKKLVTADDDVWDEYMKETARVTITDDRLSALEITKEDVNKYKEHKAKLRRCRSEKEDEDDDNVLDKSSDEQEDEEDENVSDNSSNGEEDQEDDNVGVDHVQAKLYKELKRQQRTKLPDAKHDFNNSKLEEYDIS
ncbi:hypothetical protein K1719_026395 [Acacia pycnantha]|nr:hypothetical protein K1719_026395 [Acacia pycnantha]